MASFADNGSAPGEGAERSAGEAPDEVEVMDAELQSEQGVELDIEHDIEALLSERDQFKAIALRLQADFENYKKRADRQVTDEVGRATGRLVEELLPVLDACEAAFAHGLDGIEPIWSKLLGVLQRQGLEVMDLADKPFDPTEQEAVMHEPADAQGDHAGEPVVAEVFRTGYRWHGKVLRAAMVKVKG